MKKIIKDLQIRIEQLEIKVRQLECVHDIVCNYNIVHYLYRYGLCPPTYKKYCSKCNKDFGVITQSEYIICKEAKLELGLKEFKTFKNQ